MASEYTTKIQGKEVPTFKGLLHLAHERFGGGLSIETQPIEVTPEFAIFKARVAISFGEGFTQTFDGTGDATPTNVGKNIAPHFVRMAETRAIARALRHALDVGETVAEEFADVASAESISQRSSGTKASGELAVINGGEPPEDPDLQTPRELTDERRDMEKAFFALLKDLGYTYQQWKQENRRGYTSIKEVSDKELQETVDGMRAVGKTRGKAKEKKPSA